MNTKITKTAIRFIKKDLNKKMDFEAVTDFLTSQGYMVKFYNPYEHDELIEKYKLEDFSKAVKAFTIKRKDLRLVFIRRELSVEDKLYLLLHETGHIVLAHLDKSKFTSSSILHDIEADTFAYTVLNPPKVNIRLTVTVLILTAFLGFCLGTHAIPNEAPVATSVYQNEQAEEIEYVYITPTGRKYHEENCMYVKNKNCTKLIIEEAQKNYEPCSVCNP